MANDWQIRRKPKSQLLFCWTWRCFRGILLLGKLVPEQRRPRLPLFCFSAEKTVVHGMFSA
jgi:hypothetical protein